MRYIFNFFLFLILFCHPIIGQNIVSNPGFESITECPPDSFDFDITEISDYCDNWYNPITTCESNPSLMHSCNGTMPAYSSGKYQYSRTGESMIRIRTYNSSNSLGKNNCGEGNEYVLNKLKHKLSKSKIYYLEFYVQWEYDFDQEYINAIGACFSDSLRQFELQFNETPELQKAIDYYGNFINNSDSWKRINGSYLANGGENYLYIGNFRKNEDVLLHVGLPNTYPIVCWNYIDDVSVIEFDPLPDTLVLCENQSLELNGSFLDGEYLWSTGQTDSVLLVDEIGEYILEVNIGDCFLYDTTYVIPEYIYENTSGFDTTVCIGDNLDLNINLYGEYLWSNGNKTYSIRPNLSGEYILKIETNCEIFDYYFDVEFEQCNCNIIAPNVFSPNNDGINDIFKVTQICDYPVRLSEFRIYDRWGNQMYYDINPVEAIWDGTYEGKPLLAGVYIYQIKYYFLKNNKWVEATSTGDITILK